MRRLLLLALLPIATMGQTAHVHNSVPFRLARLGGRTALNMTTFKDKRAAAVEWGIVLAWFGDAYEAGQDTHFCHGCQETNPFLPLHPHTTQIVVRSFPLAIITVMQAQGLREVAKTDKNWAVRNVAWAAPSAGWIAFETYATVDQYHIAETWKRCFANPACSARNPR